MRSSVGVVEQRALVKFAGRLFTVSSRRFPPQLCKYLQQTDSGHKNSTADDQDREHGYGDRHVLSP
jgi:hypothetical protein